MDAHSTLCEYVKTNEVQVHVRPIQLWLTVTNSCCYWWWYTYTASAFTTIIWNDLQTSACTCTCTRKIQVVISNLINSLHVILLGGWTTPLKNMSNWIMKPQGSAWKFQNFELPLPPPRIHLTLEGTTIPTYPPVWWTTASLISKYSVYIAYVWMSLYQDRKHNMNPSVVRCENCLIQVNTMPLTCNIL